jgi:hypothetical protein
MNVNLNVEPAKCFFSGVDWVRAAIWPGHPRHAVRLQLESAEDETMTNNIESERDPGFENDYSAEEAEQMGAFAEDALSEGHLASFSTHQNNLKTAFSSAS